MVSKIVFDSITAFIIVCLCALVLSWLDDGRF